MYAAAERATSSIYWEMFIFIDDEAGMRFFDLFEKKAKEGVKIILLLDSYGSFGLSKKTIARLKQSGVDIQFFFEKRKYIIRSLWRRLWSRTHRKILVIDEHIGFIGGVNIRKDMRDWLDIHVRITGPIVRSLLRAFAKGYIIAGGKKANVRHLLKYKIRTKNTADEVEFVFDQPAAGRSAVRRRYVDALRKARRRVVLFSPYYVPDKKFLTALWKARKRGVHVDLLLPLRADVRFVTYAAYGLFSLMHRYGVRVHLVKSMMHGKGIIVDDSWAMIGSSNIDHTSFFDNFEANIKITNRGFVQKITTLVEGWMQDADRMSKKTLRARGRIATFVSWLSLYLYSWWYRSSAKIALSKKKRTILRGSK